jgi:hypothetical protein
MYSAQKYLLEQLQGRWTAVPFENEAVSSNSTIHSEWKNMRVLGFAFIVGGLFITFAGFASYVSDIQLGIGISGIVLVGIGFLMIAVDGIAKDLKIIINKKEMN